MGSGLFFEKKKYISVKDASLLTGYSKDYIGQLCRQNKILSTRVGRTWYVGEESILAYKNSPSVFDFSKNLLGSNVEDKKEISALNKPLSRLSETQNFIRQNKISVRVIIGFHQIHTEIKRIVRTHLFGGVAGFTARIVPITIGLIFALGLISTEEKMMAIMPTLSQTTPQTLAEVAYWIPAHVAKVSESLNDAPRIAYDSLDNVVSLYADSLNNVYERVGLAVFELETIAHDEVRRIAFNPPLFVSDSVKTAAIAERHSTDRTLATVGDTIKTAHLRTFAFLSESLGGVPYVQKATKNLAANVTEAIVPKSPVDVAGIVVYNVINGVYDFANTLIESSVYSPAVALFNQKQIEVEHIGLPKPVSLATKIQQKTQKATGNTGIASTVLPVPSRPIVIREVTHDVISGVTQSELETRLQQFNNQISSKLATLSSGSGGNITNIYQQIAQSQHIDQLTGTNINSPVITGGSISNTNISVQSLSSLSSTLDTLSSTLATISGLNAANSTTTNATTTNSYSSNLLADNAVLGTTTINNLAVGTSTLVVSHGNIGIGTTSPGSTLSVNGNGYFTGDLTVGNNVKISGGAIVLGNSTSTTLTLTSSLNSDLVPNVNKVYNIGSPSYFWNRAYIDSLTVNNFGAASTSISGTASQSFTINSGNGTTDAQDASLIFFRGTVVPNAVLTWNHTTKRFESNQSVYVQNQSGNNTPTIVAQGSAGQNADIFQALDASGTSLLNVTAGGNVGIGTSSPGFKLDVNGILNAGALYVNGAPYIGSQWTTSGNNIYYNTGNVGIGTVAPGANLEVVSPTNPGTGRGILVTQYSNDAAAAQIGFKKYRGTTSAPLAVTNNDYAGFFGFNSYDGSSLINSAGFGAKVNGTVAAGSVPTDLFFYTSGGTNDTNPYNNNHVRMVINSNGNVGIGTTSPAAALSVLGSGSNVFGLYGSTGSTLFTVGNTGVITGPTGGAYSFDNSSTGEFSASGGYRIGNGANGLWEFGQMLFPSSLRMYWSASSNAVSTKDTSISRIGAGTLAIGNGTANDYTGTLAVGSVGIGTTTPPSLLTVGPSSSQLVSLNPLLLLGTSTLASASANGTYIGVNAPTGFFGDYMALQYNGTSVFRIGTLNGAYGLQLATNASFPGSGLSITPGRVQPGQASIAAFGQLNGSVIVNGNSLTNYGYEFTGNIQGQTTPGTMQFVRIDPGDNNVANRTSNKTALAIIPNFNGGYPSNDSSLIGIDSSGTFGNGTDRMIAGSSIVGIRIAPTINVDATSLTGYTSLKIAPVETSVASTAGVTNYLMQVGTSTNAGMFNITNTGNVGIGTSSPSQLLTVGNNNQFTVDSSGNVAALTFRGPAGSAQLFGTGIGLGYHGVVGWTAVSDYTAALDSGLSRISANKIGVGNGTNGDYSGTLIVGNVGIGTTTPWGQLSINPNALGSGVPEFVIGSSSATHLLVDGGGNVGIGRSNPTQALDVNGSIALTSGNSLRNSTGQWTNVISPYSSTGAVNINLSVSGPGFIINDSSASTKFSISPGNNSTASFFSTSVGIGTSTTGSLFTVSPTSAQLVSSNPVFLMGTSSLASPSSNGTYMGANSPTGFNGYFIDYQNNGSRKFNVLGSNGFVGIGSAIPAVPLTIKQASNNPYISLQDSGTTDWRIALGAELVPNIYIGGNNYSTQYFWRANWNTAGVAHNTFQNPESSDALTIAEILQHNAGDTGDYLHVTQNGGISGGIFDVASSGNVGIGTTTPQSQLTVSPTTLGSNPVFLLGTSTLASPSANGTYIGVNAPTGFGGDVLNFQVNGTSKIKFTTGGAGQNGAATIGNLNFQSSGGCCSANYISASGAVLALNGPVAGNNTGVQVTIGGSIGNSVANQSGEAINLQLGGNINAPVSFTPALGAGIFSNLKLNETINQTGSASGITRGIYLNPTLTSVRDYRALEIAPYTFNLGISTTTLNAELSNAFTVASTSAATVTNVYQHQITGAPIASTNVTISTSTALMIAGGAVNGGGTVTNAYGLQVFAPTGATNNYAASFMNGNVGIGLNNPARLLEIKGSASDNNIWRVTNSNYSAGTTGSSMAFQFGATTGDTYSALQAATAGGPNAGNIMLNPSGGNVGIGVTSISRGKLEIQQANDTNAGGLALVNSGITGSLRLWVDSSNVTHLDGGLANQNIALNAGGTGNVGIGTTSPVGKLQVSGAGGVNYPGNNSTLFLVQSTSNYGGIDITAPAGQNTYVGFSEATTKKAGLNWDATNAVFDLQSAGDFQFQLPNGTGSLVTIKSGGNVGIGTTSPSQLLTVGNNNQFTVDGSGNINAVGNVSSSGTFNVTNSGRYYVPGYDTSLQQNILKLYGTNQAVGDSNGNLALGKTSALYVSAAGNVGVGTTTPAYLFQVGGPGSAGYPTHPLFRVDSSGNTETYGNLTTWTGYGAFQNVRVGPSGAYGNSSISGTLGGGINMQNAASESFTLTSVNNTTAGNVFVMNARPNDTTQNLFQLQNNGTGLVTVANSGNVGIGTTSPSAKLNVDATSGNILALTNNGANQLTVDSSGNMRVYGTTVNLYSGSVSSTLNLYGGATRYVQITADTNQNTYFTAGNVGVGTTTPWKKFSVQGNVSFSGLTATSGGDSAVCISANNELTINSGVSNCTVSSARFKYDIATSSAGLDLVRALRPVSFKYNGTNDEHLGFIAEEVDLLEPRLVARNTEGQIQSVRYDEMTSILAKAIQDEDLRVTNIDTRLTHLEQLMASTSSQTGGITFSDIVNNFTALGARFEQGVVHLADTFVNRLTVGTKEKPSGITLYDDATGEPYCLKVHNGATVTLAGECAALDNATSTEAAASTTASVSAPVIAITGNNPAQVQYGTQYVDLGATVTATNPDGTVNNNLGLHFTVDGASVSNVMIDTTASTSTVQATTTHTIVYSAVDSIGNWGYATRTVEVVPIQ